MMVADIRCPKLIIKVKQRNIILFSIESKIVIMKYILSTYVDVRVGLYVTTKK